MHDEPTPQSAQPLERRLATILCADVAGYSKMMAANEERTVHTFRGHREIFESLVSLHRGRIFNTAGDALLAEFNSPVEAVRCATEIQAALRTRNEHLAPDEKMQFRMGINLGDVILQGGDLLGDGVNVAARIQTATAPGGICISGSVHDQIQNKLSLDFKLLGEQTYKNIAKPVRTYTINEGAAVTAPASRTGQRVLAAVTVAVLAVAAIAGYWVYQRDDAQRAAQPGAEARLASQLAAQKQATEQAQHAAEEARREAQLQAQKLAADDELRRAQEERNQVEQARKLLEAERRSVGAATQQAANEALRRAQEERTQLEQERKRLEAEKQAAESAKKPAEASPRVTSTAAKDAPKLAAPHDGSYSGQLCNQIPDQAPACWPLALLVRSGVVEGSWLGSAQKRATARGTVAADGSVQLNLAAWHPENGTPVDAILLGRIVDGAISASGKWSTGSRVAGEWKRTQVVATAPAANDMKDVKEVKVAPQVVASYDGNYGGRLCSHPGNVPLCWPVALVVRNGIAEGSWIAGEKKTATVRGTIAADGSVQLNLAAWSKKNGDVKATLRGRIVDGAITASGKWSHGVGVAGDWKRTP